MRLEIKLWGDSPEPIMSNSKEEWKTNQEFINNAKGDVLMIGLGIGYTLPFILSKIDSIDIVEKEQEVIDLAQIFHAVHDSKVKIIKGDGTTFIPDRQYDTIFWDTFGLPDEVGLENINRLSNYLKPNGWIGRWEYGQRL